jgi:hypothetical protein
MTEGRLSYAACAHTQTHTHTRSLARTALDLKRSSDLAGWLWLNCVCCACVRACVRACTCARMRAFVRACVRACVRVCVWCPRLALAKLVGLVSSLS